MNPPEIEVMELIHGADRSKWIVRSNHMIRCFTEGEIERITNKYKTIVGLGGFGQVYLGVLEDTSMVAVKRFIHNVKENFAKELIVHREINHRNVVRLIGYCVEENALTMVTEYIPNGSLSDVLHRYNIPIPLDIRLKIATGCAEALAYIHSHMYTQVIHGDIKPANILLDGSLNAKISDFGISRLVNTDKMLYTEHVIGSIGYMDPLFARDGLLTVKSDVYSFGVVLFELITRKKAERDSTFYFFTNGLNDGRMRSVREKFDADIADKNNMGILTKVSKLAGECLAMERDKRPEMIDAAERLRKLQKALSHQGQQRVDLLSLVRKGKPAAPVAEVTIPTKTLPLDLCRRFSFEEMNAATNTFDQSLLIGEGSFGAVYRGEIDNGATKVAIKRCHSWSMHRSLEFHTEIEIMSRLRHNHIVPLIGYCNEEDKMILVYEYMARGSLHDHLYMTQGQESPLTWEQRLEICIGVSRGLHHLRSGTVDAIIHRNVSASNILLDEEWVAKITDVGLSRTQPSTDFREQIADTKTGPSTWHTAKSYIEAREDESAINIDGGVSKEVVVQQNSLLALQKFRNGRLADKSDVYSFGAVLIEVLFARPFVPEEHAWIGELNSSRIDTYYHIFNNPRIQVDGDGVDPCLKGKIRYACLEKFCKTAARCVDHAKYRPSMENVLWNLDNALQLQTREIVTGREPR